MNFDWEEYFKLAEELAKGQTEAKARSSISRAYYAIFNIAKQIIEEKDPFIKVPTINVHGWLISYLKSPRDRFSYQLSQDIRILRDSRNDADYDSSPISFKKANQSLELARSMIEKLKNWRT